MPKGIFASTLRAVAGAKGLKNRPFVPLATAVLAEDITDHGRSIPPDVLAYIRKRETPAPPPRRESRRDA